MADSTKAVEMVSPCRVFGWTIVDQDHLSSPSSAPGFSRSLLRHPRAGTAAHKWLRIVHNRALDLGWLLTPVLARKLWPRLQTKKTKAISAEQHAQLVATEKDKEFRLYLEVLSEIGGAQTDTARLRRENVDLLNRHLTYNPQKLENAGQGSA